jgi:hypothetical protein
MKKKPESSKPTARYVVIGGTPVRSYTGTTTFSSLKVLGKGWDESQVKEVVERYYDPCGGLLCVIDLQTGEMV